MVEFMERNDSKRQLQFLVLLYILGLLKVFLGLLKVIHL